MSITVSRFSPPELLVRPDPGLARGQWEAPSWLFWLVAVGAMVAGLVFVALALRKVRSSR